MVFTITCIEGTLLSYIIDIIVIYTEYMPCTCKRRELVAQSYSFSCE
jgi:hypothetical protein